MRSLVRRTALLIAVSMFGGLAAIAVAGSAHFVKSDTTVYRSGDSLVAEFKVAGLGDENQIRVVLSATGQCVNPGSMKPQAGNKQAFRADGRFPVQNGKAEGTLSLTATFQPSCTPPMTIEYTNVTLRAYDTNGTLDTSDDILVASFSVSGTF